jgi:formylglycine-generating enzyme required for sulfatase activity
MGPYAFYGNPLTSVTLSDHITQISEGLFKDTLLETVNIGTGVTSIGPSAFESCGELATITINRTSPPTLGNYAFYEIFGFSIEVPAASVAAYEAAAGWSSYAPEIVAQPVPLNLTMISIPTGSFKRDGTASIHTVSTFKMSEMEITRAQYLSVVGTDPSITLNSSGLTDPVQNVTWFDAVEFCNMLSADEGLTEVYTITGRTPATGYPITAATVTVSNWSATGYRLPTDMEWRWAAMGGASDARAGDIVGGVNTGGFNKGYAGSTEALQAQVNMGTYAVYGYSEGPTTTSPVGSKTENELDLFDMTGNVSEWVWDLQEPGVGYPVGDWTDYRGYATGSNMVNGGNWFNWANFCPIAMINYWAPSTRAKYIGFRVVHP